MLCRKIRGLIPPGSGTSQTGHSWCVGEGVHLLEYGGWFPAPASSIAERVQWQSSVTDLPKKSFSSTPIQWELMTYFKIIIASGQVSLEMLDYVHHAHAT